ncbi:MAG: PhzF family phenazine biosynthesis protein [Limnohabitans sp.]|jgi:PhzF family phenazine biosynthesis protein|uniref:PhzF family phenazine biosynthesis protein n=1 Tax=Limnohabitans sp. TaxID=1907725 RepID=UPI0025F34A98|nr:PhzF family phenazine biosynthesis protein [Limnohabitans sp.]MCO4089647.1 PhzF family phenazine biosynthesis protein [Limnohabitans sp.]
MKFRAFQQVDVFTDTAFLGNPLAVVLDGTGLSDAQMQTFAAWTQLSETTFVLPPTTEGVAGGADYRVRIFTPGAELPFAGHPTLGTAHAWLKAGNTPRQPGVLMQECGVGLVTLKQQGERWAFAAPPLKRSDISAEDLAPVLAALGLDASEVIAAQNLNNGPHWLGLLVDSVDTVLALEPDHAALKKLGTKVGVAAKRQTPDGGLIRRANREARAFTTSSTRIANDPTDLEVRAFAAPVGVTEDPVTGSLNASLAQWLMDYGHMPAAYSARQGTVLGRAGQVFLSQDSQRQVWVGGDVVGCIQGTVNL